MKIVDFICGAIIGLVVIAIIAFFIWALWIQREAKKDDGDNYYR